MNYEKFNKYLHSETRSIVVNGSFAPSMFQPAWFASRGLIGKEEADSAAVEVIIPDYCQLTIGGFEFVCNRNRLQVLTRKSPYFLPLADLVIQIFQLCPETPVRNMGINTSFFFDMQNADNYYDIGNEIATLQRWNRILPDSRLQSISIEGKVDENNCQTYLRINPSNVERLSFGVEFAINNHFVLKGGNGDTVVKHMRQYSEDYMRKSKEWACNTIEEFAK